MDFLIFISTFMACGLTLLAVLQRFQGRRRAQTILKGRDPSEQRATALRAPSLTQRWEIAARQAGLDWTARTYFWLICAGAGLGGLFTLAGQFGIGIIAMAVAAVGPWLVVRHQQRIRTEKFAAQMPAALTLAANTIRSGGTMLQAVRAIARQMPDPIRGEFVRVEQALQLQVPLPTALEQARGRIGAHEFAAVVIACKVAGQAGADLDLVLENISREIVEDRQFRHALHAASSEGRTSAKVVTAIPFAAGGYFLVTSPGYFTPLLGSVFGQVLLLLCFTSIFVGWFLINRITDIRNW